MKHRDTAYLTEEQILVVLSAIEERAMKIMVLLMIDCGLNMAEIACLKFSDFDLKAMSLTITKMRSKLRLVKRNVLLTSRIYKELSHFMRTLNIATCNDLYLFPSTKAGQGHFLAPSYYAKARLLSKKFSLPILTVTLLRNTYIRKQLQSGVSAHQLKELLGHERIVQSVRYRDEFQSELETQPEKSTLLTYRPQSIFTRAIKFILPPTRRPDMISNRNSIPHVLIGRDTDFEKVHQLMEMKINTIIIGEVGVGKSFLLQNIEEAVKASEQIKMFKIDDLNDLRASLSQILLYLLKTDHLGVYNHLFPEFDYDKQVIKVSRSNTVHLAHELMKLTEKKQYTLLIDNIDRITERNARVLELFKDHFTILTSSRALPVSRFSLVWNFEIIRLQPLKRADSLKLIEILSNGLAPQSQWVMRNHIFEQTNGNPRAIGEMIERYSKAPELTNRAVRNLLHPGALPEYDCTFLILIFLACVACLRYLNHEVQNASFRVLGGIALVFLFISRYFFKVSKRQNI